MKRFVIAVTALSMLAPAAALAAPRHDDHRPHAVQKHVTVKKKVVTRRWSRGHRLPSEYRSHAVDYRRYHLRRPGHGERWVRVGNEYLLITITSGVIASVVAAH